MTVALGGNGKMDWPEAILDEAADFAYEVFHILVGMETAEMRGNLMNGCTYYRCSEHQADFDERRTEEVA